MERRLVIGMSGASGTVYGIRLLEVLRTVAGVESHLVVSRSAEQTARHETGHTIQGIHALADVTYGIDDIGAAIASGSFRTLGMVVIPCSIKTLAGVANSYSDNLLLRAADVTLKDRRRLVLVVRETPLHLGHLQAMTRVTEMGGIIAPPIPAFYHQPKTVDDIVNHTVNRVLDLLGIELDRDLIQRWQGLDS